MRVSHTAWLVATLLLCVALVLTHPSSLAPKATDGPDQKGWRSYRWRDADGRVRGAVWYDVQANPRPAVVPTDDFGAADCGALASTISQRMARIEMESPSIATAVLDAVTGELVYYDNLVRDARGFTAAEIAAESPS